MNTAFQDLVRRFLDDLQIRNYRPRTVTDYGYHLGLLGAFLERRGVDDPAAITTPLLADFQRWLYYQPTKHGAARGVGNQNTVLAAVKSFMRFLRREGILVRDPAAELEYAREPRRLPRNVLTPAEARRILEAARPETPLAQRDRALLEVFYATGIRRDELRHLRPEDIDFEQELLRVNEGKGGHERIVPMGAVAARCLETYLNAVRPALLRGRACRWLFVSFTGRQIDPNTLNAIVRKYARAAKVRKHVTCHTWRHSCATHLVQNNANVRHVQEMLGHRSLSTTERYLRLTITDLKAAHAKFHPREKEQRRLA